MSIFSYDKMILAMKHNATAKELEPLVAEACGASEYLFGERCRALCLALCLNPNLSEDQMRRLAKRWPHHITQNASWLLLMLERPAEPPKPVDNEPGETDEFQKAENIMIRPHDECDAIRPYIIARLIEGLISPYSFVVLECAKRLESMRQDSWGWRLDERMKEARSHVAERLASRALPLRSKSDRDYQAYLEMVGFCRDEFFRFVASTPGNHDGSVLMFLWQERDRFEDVAGFDGVMAQLVDRVAFSDVGAFWATPWLAEAIREYGSSSESVKSMCAMLYSSILNPEQEAALVSLIAHKRKECMLTQETPCPKV